MDDRLIRLEAKVEELARSVHELGERVALLEGADRRLGREDAAWSEAGAGAGEAAAPVPSTAPEEAPAWGVLALVGRTLMVLGGAYLFRALTEGGAVPAHVGLLLGLAYAFLWLLFADRAEAAAHPPSAAFHGASFALIAEPLAWEAAGRFGAVGAAGGALGIALFTGCALGVAWRRRLRAVAWIAVLGAIFSAWALMASIEPVLPAVAVLVAVTIAADWLSLPRAEAAGGAGQPPTHWRGLPWLPAAATDLTLAVIAVESIFGRPEVLEDRAGFLWLLLALFVGSAGSVAARALVGARWRPRWFDLVQTPAAVMIGYGGAWGLARHLEEYGVVGAGTVLGLGLASALLAGLLYAAAFPLVERRPARRPAYILLTVLALVLAVGGGGLLLPAAGRAAAWSVLAVAGVWAAGRWRTVTLGLQGFVYALLAAVDSGLLVDAAVAFAGDPTGSAGGAPEGWLPAWPALSPVALAVLVALGVAASLRLPAESPFWGRAARVPKLLLLGALVWAAGGAVLIVVLPWVAPLESGEAGEAMVAAVRTAFVAGVALALAWVSRFERFREARFLAYAVLAGGAVKLVLEDLLLGRPGELFVALAVFGGALILAPRLARG